MARCVQVRQQRTAPGQLSRLLDRDAFHCHAQMPLVVVLGLMMSGVVVMRMLMPPSLWVPIRPMPLHKPLMRQLLLMLSTTLVSDF